jgi:rhodanese-related sulfurtransferase
MERISREQLQTKMHRGEDFALVEVLGPEQFGRFHLPAAINVPVGEGFEESMKEAVPDKTRPIVVYCANTECDASPKAARKLDEMGYAEVYDYAGGKEDWKSAGNPMEEQA